MIDISRKQVHPWTITIIIARQLPAKARLVLGRDLRGIYRITETHPFVMMIPAHSSVSALRKLQDQRRRYGGMLRQGLSLDAMQAISTSLQDTHEVSPCVGPEPDT